MEARVMTARTVEEAIELALKELDADRDEAEVEVLSEGKAGFLGIGAERARVRVTKIPQGGSAAAVANEALNRILQAAGVSVSRTLRAANDPEVGGTYYRSQRRRRRTLDWTTRADPSVPAIPGQPNRTKQLWGRSTGCPGCRELPRASGKLRLREMASKVASRVVQSSRSITLEPMTPADRRIVHTTLY